MTINFYLNKRANTPAQSIQIYIRISKDKTFIYSIGERINPKLWDKDKQHAKKSYIGSPQLNYKLDTIKTSISQIVREIETDARKKNENISLSCIKNVLDKYFNKSTDIDKTLFQTLDLFSSIRKNDVSINFLKKITTLKNHLTEFEQVEKYPISFDTINLLFYDKFRSYQWKTKKNCNSTTYSMINVLKIFLNWCTARGINTNIEFKKFKVLSDKVDTIHLTSDELFAILNLDLSKSPHLDNVRNVFCFACFTGARFSDVDNLRWNDIRNNVWYLRTIKTNDILMIPLNGYAVSIIDQYKGEDRPLRVISNHKMNDYLKTICEKANIIENIKVTTYIGAKRTETIYQKFELVGTHTARRTFITLSLEKGMSPEVVMAMTGHKDYRTFKKYIKITDKVKQNEMNRVWTAPHLKIVENL